MILPLLTVALVWASDPPEISTLYSKNSTALEHRLTSAEQFIATSIDSTKPSSFRASAAVSALEILWPLAPNRATAYALTLKSNDSGLLNDPYSGQLLSARIQVALASPPDIQKNPERSAQPAVIATRFLAQLRHARVTGNLAQLGRLTRTARESKVIRKIRGPLLMEVRAFSLLASIQAGFESDRQIMNEAKVLAKESKSSQSESGDFAFACAELGRLIAIYFEMSEKHPVKRNASLETQEAQHRAFVSSVDQVFLSAAANAEIKFSESLYKYGPQSRTSAVWNRIRLTASIGIIKRNNGASPSEQDLAQNARDALRRLKTESIYWLSPSEAAGRELQIEVTRFGNPNGWKQPLQAVIESHKSEPKNQESALRALSALPLLVDVSPETAADLYKSCMSTFAETIQDLAVENPNMALHMLSNWRITWSMYKRIATSSTSMSFLEGYLQASGIVKNVSYATRTSAIGARRLLGPISMRQITQKIPLETKLVVFIRFQEPNATIGSKDSYGAYILEQEGIPRFFDLGSAKTIDDSIRNWKLSQRGPNEPPAPVRPEEAGSRLFQLLLKPIFPEELPRNLVIVPDSEISELSLASLRTQTGRWLVQDVKISYLSTLRDLLTQFSTSDNPSKILYSTSFAGGYPSLPRPKMALESLLRLDPRLQKQPFLRASVKSLEAPRYLHLSTHGIFDPKRAADISTENEAVGLVPAKSDTPDSMISAAEASEWNLRGTQLVTLSACHSGASENLPGEGPGGLRRALRLAGARQVISSLRFVESVGRNDAPGDAIYSAVYDGINRGLDGAAALQRAQHLMLKNPQTASPYFWASYVCEGV